jgi:uncharacterized protein YjaG (DUF416 family)
MPFSEGANIAVMEKYFGLGQSYEVWTPIDATEAAQLLLDALAKVDQEVAAEMVNSDDYLIEQSLVALEEYQQTGRSISHEAMKQWANGLADGSIG